LRLEQKRVWKLECTSVKNDSRLYLPQRGLPVTAHRASDWKLIAEQSSKEMDSEKLMSLVRELSRALDQEEEMSQHGVKGMSLSVFALASRCS